MCHAGCNAHPVAEGARRRLDAGRSIIGMGAETARQCAVLVEIAAAEDTEVLEHHVLRQATMPLRHEEGVEEAGSLVDRGIATHQAVIDDVYHFEAGEGR